MQGLFTGMAIFMTVLFLCGCGANKEIAFVSEEDTGTSYVETADYEKKDPVSEKSELHTGKSDTEKTGIQNGEDLKQYAQDGTDEAGIQMQAQENGSDAVVLSSEDEECYVHVCGAVHAPGVYRLAKGARVFEAIELAGGITEDGYGDGLNQALEVRDGDRVWVPMTEQWEQGITDMVSGDETGAGHGVGFDEEALTTAAEPGSGQALEDKVDINTADAAQLCTLPGIGQAKAEAVIAYRQSHGAFSDISQIKNVTGIKEGLYCKIKDKIKV